MLLRTFRGGIHPPQLKNLTKNLATKKFPTPKRVVIPLSQHIGAICEPVLNVGDAVKKGDMVGKSDKFISSPVHASISGKVARIYECPHPVIGKSPAIEIEWDGNDVSEFRPKSESDVKRLSAGELLEKINTAGVIGMGGAGFPTHVKLSPPKSKPIDSFVLNGAECEPFITCDHRLMLEKPLEILKGAEIISRILDVKNVYIAIEDNKKDAIELMKKTSKNCSLFAVHCALKVISLPTKYPQGAEKQLLKAVLNREVPVGGLPMDVGCVVHNVSTAFAIYEAVFLEKPLIERYITITGDCVKEASNLLIPVGTLISDIVEFAGCSTKDVEKIIIGGPMMGIAQYTTDIPAIKGTNGIVVLSKGKVKVDEESICIRCSRCIEVCPVYLMPTDIMRLVKKERFEQLKEYDPKTCFECGACAYECPSKISLVDYLKFAKTKV